MQVLKSTHDASVNFVEDAGPEGFFESRYVRRVRDYFIAYISSHTGCKQACRFCHLTQTGQTGFMAADHANMLGQLENVLAHYDQEKIPAERLNINFMARGEALLNEHLTGDFDAFALPARAAAARRGLKARFNISTIFPKEAAHVDLVKAFDPADTVFYWSLYSLDPNFRRRWLPKAEDPEVVAAKLLRWQEAGGEIVLHWALIEDQNDQDEVLQGIADFVKAKGLRARLNLVRYNPHSDKTGREASDERYNAALSIVGDVMEIEGSRIVPRVGFDVKASCGMFVS